MAKKKTGPTVKQKTELLKLIKAGIENKTACAVVNVDYSTFKSWLSVLPDFAKKVQQARDSRTHRYLAVVIEAALDGDWRAATWLLEKLEPKVFGKLAEKIQEAREGIQQRVLLDVPTEKLEKIAGYAARGRRSKQQGKTNGKRKKS